MYYLLIPTILFLIVWHRLLGRKYKYLNDYFYGGGIGGNVMLLQVMESFVSCFKL